MSNGSKFIEGLALGGMVGFFCGLLSAPKAGKELRQELLSESEDLYKQALDSVSDMKVKTDQAIAALQAKGENLVKTVCETFSAKKENTQEHLPYCTTIDNCASIKAIASCGYCSRRAADKLIADGKVQVNGKRVSDFSLQVNLDKDKVIVASRTIHANPHQYVLLHKPVGIVSTCKDDHGRRKA